MDNRTLRILNLEREVFHLHQEINRLEQQNARSRTLSQTIGTNAGSPPPPQPPPPAPPPTPSGCDCTLPAMKITDPMVNETANLVWTPNMMPPAYLARKTVENHEYLWMFNYGPNSSGVCMFGVLVAIDGLAQCSGSAGASPDFSCANPVIKIVPSIAILGRGYSVPITISAQ